MPDPINEGSDEKGGNSSYSLLWTWMWNESKRRVKDDAVCSLNS